MQQILAVRSKFHQYFAPILIALPASYCTVIHQTINQLHRTVMPQT